MQKEESGETQAMMTVIANGHKRELGAGSTIVDLLCACNVTTPYVVVQLEGKIVPRADFAQVVLQDGNRLEIVTLVGGG